MRWENHTCAALVGATIRGVDICDNGIRFHIGDDKPMAFYLVEDCCSETWLYSVRNFDALKEPVEEIVEIDLSHIDPKDGLGRQDEDDVHGFGLKTAAGVFEIVYRNSSNGYYTGWIERGSDRSEWRGEWEPVCADWFCAVGEYL